MTRGKYHKRRSWRSSSSMPFSWYWFYWTIWEKWIYRSKNCKKVAWRKKHPKARIEKIEWIIMATVLFSKPKNILEEIIQDADLDNIWTKEEFYYSLDYLDEIRRIGKIDMPDCAYWQFVYTLLTKYKFHTPTAKRKDILSNFLM